MWCQLHGENRTEAIPKTSDISVPGFGIRIFFPQISDTAIWHFILDVISYLLSKTEFTVPLKNESPHGREVKKHCFIIPRSKEPC